MLFHVRMDVNIPIDFDEKLANEIKAVEKAYSQDLQKQGKWRHLWRISGQYSNISIFDVESNDELNTILQGLPLYKFMNVEIMPLNRHTSSIRDDDS